MKPWRPVKGSTIKTFQKELCSKGISPKFYYSLLKNILNEKIFFESRLLFAITNLLQILVKNPISLILFSFHFFFFFFFFAKHCSIIENSSVLPSSTNSITGQYLANIEFAEDDIKRIIYKLDPNKVHGHDMVSIHRFKMSGDAKKRNIVPIFTISDKQ